MSPANLYTYTYFFDFFSSYILIFFVQYQPLVGMKKMPKVMRLCTLQYMGLRAVGGYFYITQFRDGRQFLIEVYNQY